MPINILMPALSPTMEKGNLAKWLKKEGDAVKSGDVIAEIETDKATMEVEAVDDGTLAKILVPEGTQDVAVNDIIAVLAGEGEDVKAAGAGAKRHAAPRRSPAPQPAAQSSRRLQQPAELRRRQPPHRTAPAAAAAVNGRSGQARIFSSPLARRLAKEAGHRARPHQRHGPAWPRRRARRRGREVRQGPQGCRQRQRRPHPRRRGTERAAGPRDVCGGQLRGRPARQHAQDHRAAADASRSRRSRIST